MSDLQQLHDLVREGQQRQHLGDEATLPREQLPAVPHLAAQKDVIDAALEVIRRDRERVQPLGPAREEIAHPFLARGRVRNVPPASLEGRQIRGVAVDDRGEGGPLEGCNLVEARGGRSLERGGGQSQRGGGGSQRGGDKRSRRQSE